MKIPGSVRRLHEEQQQVAELLKTRADQFFEQNRREVWHYTSRVKELESFALKLESGRFRPGETEDLFAATLVVRNRRELDDAERLVRERFDVVERRPENDSLTMKRPDSFRFDEIRLYGAWKDDGISPPSSLGEIRAEIQIKTFLLHAWSLATHDLVYKTAEPSWGLERIAYQIRATLEGAEVAIEEAEQLARSRALPDDSRETQRLSKTIALLREAWDAERLPGDLRRLGGNVEALMRAVDLPIDTLPGILDSETQAGRGVALENLSPFGTIVQSLINQHPERFERFARRQRERFRVLLTPELELPEKSATWRNVIRVET